MFTQRRVTRWQTGRARWLTAAVVGAVCLGAAPAQAGARIDLRPTPPMPPGGYAPNTIIDVDVVLVDTGNPDGDIWFIGIDLDFSATSGAFTYPGEDRIVGTPDDNRFSWFNPMGFNWVLPQLPKPSWTHSCDFAACPDYLFILPDSGEVSFGSLVLDVGSNGGILDVVNMSGPPGSGTWLFPTGDATFSYWGSRTGDLTGGTLNIVVPEPRSVLLLLASVSIATLRRRKHRPIHSLRVDN